MKIIGTCGLCGGPVAQPTEWLGTLPPVSQCLHCKARPANPYGQRLTMLPANIHATGCPQCGAGRNGEPYGYACDRSDCPYRAWA